jgi:3-oxoacyl-[acyl-carrier protein] reductase
MDLGIEGKVALVMGASRGIGRGIAGALAGEGAKVAVVSRSAVKLAEAVEEIGSGATAFVADAGDLERMASLPAEIEGDLGPVEILVTNTGGPPMGGALDHGLPEWEDAFRTLVLGPKVLVDAVVPGMRERGWGRIVNVGSSSTREPIPHLNLSNSIRMATVGYLKTLSREVAAEGITVNTVATGKFATERLAANVGSIEQAEELARHEVPAARLGTPAEFGDLVAFLCSQRAAYVTGTVIPIDGGMLRSI